MQQTVTAIVVARAAGDHLERTLQALASSTRRPDSVIVIGRGDVQDAARAASRTLPVSYLEARDRLGFPAAIAAAARTLSPPRSGDEWLWLLSQDTAPEPAALERMLAVGETSPSVALAGPKLVEWDDRTRIRDFGVTMTRFGRAVPLVEGELDQAQHDG
ncbi:glycosyltransferase, partial [Gryllotalpicola sp.]|uniref:glycosyltransferase family 2 protein n=1 Tax=Gryllotalpicola sp. TaxID=1932787 RepID=UPI002630F877